MSEVLSGFSNIVVDDILSEATTNASTKALERTLGKMHRTSNRLFSSKCFAALKKGMLTEVKLPLVQGLVSKGVSDQASAWVGKLVNNPVSRHAIICSSIAGIALAVGYTLPIAGLAILSAYTIKTLSAYGFMATVWALKAGFRALRGSAKDKQDSSRDKSAAKKGYPLHVNWMRARQHLARTIFGLDQKSTAVNLVDIALSITSAVLLMPVTAHAAEWVSGMVAARPDRMAFEAARKQGVMTVSEAVAERTVAREAAVQTVETIAHNGARQGLKSGGINIGQLCTRLLRNAVDRSGGVVAQGTIKFFGHNLAKKPQTTIEAVEAAAMGVAAAVIASGAEHSTPPPVAPAARMQTIGNTVISTPKNQMPRFSRVEVVSRSADGKEVEFRIVPLLQGGRFHFGAELAR